MKHQIQNLPKNQKKIEIQIPAWNLKSFLGAGRSAEEMKIPAFARQSAGRYRFARIDPKHLLEAAADSAVRNTLYSLVAEQKWETVGGPEVNIKKMARVRILNTKRFFAIS